MDFPALQQQLFERINEDILQYARLFKSRHLTELGLNLCDLLLASEKDLEAYQHLAVKGPTTHIIS
jgi:hypothetical protein